MNAKLIGERIKEYRKLNNLSQRELAEQLFVSDKTISRWELGNGLPDIELLPKIAEILGISIDKLVGAENLSGENDELEALDLYREELKKREALLIEKEEKVKLDTVNRNKLKRIYVAAAAALL